MMYYFTCDDENLEANEPVLVKSMDITRLIAYITGYNDYDWNISNMPINFDEEDYKEI